MKAEQLDEFDPFCAFDSFEGAYETTYVGTFFIVMSPCQYNEDNYSACKCKLSTLTHDLPQSSDHHCSSVGMFSLYGLDVQ